MVLTATGSWYRVPVYITTKDQVVVPGASGPDSCYDKNRRWTAARGSTPGNKAAAAVSTAASGSTTTDQAAANAVKASTHAAEPRDDYNSHEERLVYKGEAEIYSGPMTVTSMTHPNPYTSAWFQYVRFTKVDDGAQPVKAPQGALVVEPFTYYLSFVEPAAASY